MRIEDFAQLTRFLPGSRLLDVGCADGRLYRMLKDRIKEYVGIDPALTATIHLENGQLISGQYPFDLPELPRFDVITILAVIEHLSKDLQIEAAQSVMRHLVPNGFLIITTSSPHVDPVLHFFKWLGLIDGIALEEHRHFDVRQVPHLFEFDHLKLVVHNRFQLGLNHLFVYRKQQVLV